MIEKPNDLPHCAGCDCDWCTTYPEPAHGEENARRSAAACSRLADYLESPPPYRKHVTKDRLWLVLDAHGDSVLWSDQELAVEAAVEALNSIAEINAENS